MKIVDKIKKENFNLATILKLLDIKRSTYYYWVKKYRIEIIKTHSPETDNNTQITLTNPITPPKGQKLSLKTHFPIFQINYHKEQKDYIKELISKINIYKLDALKLSKLNSKKLDNYNNPIKTHYKWGLNTIYYRLEDLKYIKSFFIQKKSRLSG
ncbi:hypothetical protein [Maize bushy stunt phytoplasma]|uniref:hypothetical protein n=1 Tax=Maize bushy stunt phytoplasma TaxID=202462 RepID=UPI002A4E1EB0|nr:hypothetical protein [Maize bushy stunt phytoplasma]